MSITLFYGKTNPELSNHFIAPFVIEGQTYPSVEHYFMIEKARIFDPSGDVLIAMTTEDNTPAKMKKLGKQVKNFNPAVWDYEGRKAMYHGVYTKFKGNLELSHKLLDTGYDILAEASPWDKKWGIGMGKSSPNVYNPEKWGRNWLGLILMGVRAELRYGPMDFDNIDDAEIAIWMDFFYRMDWVSFIMKWSKDPKASEQYYWKSLCAQAEGVQGGATAYN